MRLLDSLTAPLRSWLGQRRRAVQLVPTGLVQWCHIQAHVGAELGVRQCPNEGLQVGFGRWSGTGDDAELCSEVSVLTGLLVIHLPQTPTRLAVYMNKIVLPFRLSSRKRVWHRSGGTAPSSGH